MTKLIEANAIQIPLDATNDVVDQLVDLNGENLTLGCFRTNATKQLTGGLASKFSDLADRINKQLCDPLCSLVAVDVPVNENYSESQNFIGECAAIASVFKAVELPRLSDISGAEFSLSCARHSDKDDLRQFGFEAYEVKNAVRFHVDGAIFNDMMEVPNVVATYNAFIGYKKAGDFRWVPVDGRAARSHFETSVLVNCPANIELSPALHADGGVLKRRNANRVTIPIIFLDDKDVPRYFINGQPSVDNLSEMVGLFFAIQESLATNDFMIAAEQKERRALFMRNSTGFHARDRFDEPFLDLDLSRVFLRMIGQGAVRANSTVLRGAS